MSESVDYFGDDTAIFNDKELLQVSHLPDGDRIIGREDELRRLGTALRPALNGNTPNNIFLYGKTGTGKSLCTKFISRQMMQRAGRNDVNAGFAYIDCLQDSTETQVVQSIAAQLNDEKRSGTTIPEQGISTSMYYNRLWTVLEHMYDVAIIILDEVDKLEGIGDKSGDTAGDNLLMNLSRANEAGKIDECNLGVIGISNKIRYKDELNERVKSSLCERDYVFPPYDATQLREILESRRDAFVDGVLETDVIPKVAALAAREHGDARKAIDVLRFAGEVAEEERKSVVRDEHVDVAQDREGANRISELISKQPPHARYVLLALASQVQQSNEEEPVIPNKVVQHSYHQICEQMDSEPLKERRVRDLLTELEFLDLIKQDQRGRGRGKGKHTVNSLYDEPKLVIQACQNDF